MPETCGWIRTERGYTSRHLRLQTETSQVDLAMLACPPGFKVIDSPARFMNDAVH
jgi:hypothetical protein